MATRPAVPYYSGGDEFTCHVSAQVYGKRFVSISGAPTDERPTVTLAAAGSQALGVSAHDAATGEGVTVYRAPNVMPVTAGAALTAGALVETNAAGEAIPLATGRPLGVCLNSPAALQDAKIALL